MSDTKRPRFGARRFASLLAAFSFLVLLASGIALFVKPPGWFAHDTGWTLWGFTKARWEALHIVFAACFILASVIHLWVNWRPLMSYFRNRERGPGREFVLALLVCGGLAWATLGELKPVTALLDWQAEIKHGWAAQPGEAVASDVERCGGRSGKAAVAGRGRGTGRGRGAGRGCGDREVAAGGAGCNLTAAPGRSRGAGRGCDSASAGRGRGGCDTAAAGRGRGGCDTAAAGRGRGGCDTAAAGCGGGDAGHGGCDAAGGGAGRGGGGTGCDHAPTPTADAVEDDTDTPDPEPPPCDHEGPCVGADSEADAASPPEPAAESAPSTDKPAAGSPGRGGPGRGGQGRGGFGRRTLAEHCDTEGLDLDTTTAILRAAGVDADPDAPLRTIAAELSIYPRDLLDVLDPAE